MSRKKSKHRGAGAPKRSGPVRTCAGCRETAAAKDLIRLVSVDGRAAVDLRGRMPGRGAWVHGSRACLDGVIARPSSLRKALGEVPDVTGLEADLTAVLHSAALNGLSMAQASGSLVGGQTLLSNALQDGVISYIVLASDASERTVRTLQQQAGDAVVFCSLPLDREALGRRIGKGARAAVGVRASRGSLHLRTQLRRLVDLG